MRTLQEFVWKTVVPAFEQLRYAQQHENLPTTRGAYASMFESFLWLHLGTEVGVFPAERSQEIAASFYADFFRSLNRPRMRFQRGWTLLANSMCLTPRNRRS